MKTLAWYVLAVALLTLTAAAYLNPNMVLAAWGALALCFS